MGKDWKGLPASRTGRGTSESSVRLRVQRKEVNKLSEANHHD